MSKVYKKTGKENICGKEKTIYELDDEKYIKQKGKKGEVYIEVKNYVQKKIAKGECLNPLIDRRLQILNKIMKKSSSANVVLDNSSNKRRISYARRVSEARKASAARRASASLKAKNARRSSAVRRASAAHKAKTVVRARTTLRSKSVVRERSPVRARTTLRARSEVRASSKKRKVKKNTNSSSFKLSPGPSQKPVNVQEHNQLKISKLINSNKSSSSKKKQCKINCEKDNRICNTKTGRCIKPKKNKLEILAERPCKQDCTAINKICKISTRRCVKPPITKPMPTESKFKHCKKECGEGKTCNFLSGRCIKQK